MVVILPSIAPSDIPSEFSMILGALPSITATAELVVPRSIPMTWPLIFSSAPSAYVLLKDEVMGDLNAEERREGVARTCSSSQ